MSWSNSKLSCPDTYLDFTFWCVYVLDVRSRISRTGMWCMQHLLDCLQSTMLLQSCMSVMQKRNTCNLILHRILNVCTSLWSSEVVDYLYFWRFLQSSSWEKRLLRKLFPTNPSLHDVSSRPVADVNATVRVKMSVGLIKLDLDEKMKVLSLSTWTRYVSLLLRHRECNVASN